MDYDAFISHSHTADGELAPALQTGLQQFAKPWYRLRALRLFRDQSSCMACPGAARYCPGPTAGLPCKATGSPVRPDGRHIATIAEQALVIFDGRSGELKYPVEGAGIDGVSFTPDGRFIAVSPPDDDARIPRADSGIP